MGRYDPKDAPNLTQQKITKIHAGYKMKVNFDLSLNIMFSFKYITISGISGPKKCTQTLKNQKINSGYQIKKILTNVNTTLSFESLKILGPHRPKKV